jgi:hypothetical protein
VRSAVSADLDATHRSFSAVANSATLTGMKTETPRPTLEELRRGTPWRWVVCEHCMRRWHSVRLSSGGGRTHRATCFAIGTLHQVRPQGCGASTPELGGDGSGMGAVPSATVNFAVNQSPVEPRRTRLVFSMVWLENSISSQFNPRI